MSSVTVVFTPAELNDMMMKTSTWPILIIVIFALVMFIGIQNFLTPKDASNIRGTRWLGGFNAVLYDEFGNARIARVKTFLDGMFGQSQDGRKNIYITPIEQPLSDRVKAKAKAQGIPVDELTNGFAALNETLRNASHLDSTGKPLLVGFDKHGVMFPAKFVKALQDTKKYKPKVVPAAAAKVEGSEVEMAEGLTVIEPLNPQVCRLFLEESISPEVLKTYGAYMERIGMGAEKDRGGGNKVWLILIGVVVLAFIGLVVASAMGIIK